MDDKRLRYKRRYMICLTIIVWAALLASIMPMDVYANKAGLKDKGSSNAETSELAQAKYKFSRPEEDLRIIYLNAGERMFHEGELEKAREAFEKVIELDSKDPKAHYYLGLVEYEEGNIEKAKTRFQIAHECLGTWVDNLEIPVEAKQVQVEFSDDYETRTYYKDGWYITPKESPNIHKSFHSLDTGSTYRIKIKSGNKVSWVFKSVMIGSFIMLSFFLSR